MVYVIDKQGNPLMPMERYGKVRRMLKSGQARVYSRTPFVIQLCYDIKEPKCQEVVLGVDAGHKELALSGCSSAQELYAAKVMLRTEVPKLMEAKKNFKRRRKINRRYRAKRSQNRKRNSEHGWAAPSVKVKVDEIIQAILRVKQILPVTEVRMEIAEFNYPQIRQYIYDGIAIPHELDLYDVRQYMLWNSYHTCESCKGREDTKKLIVVGQEAKDMVVLCANCYLRYEAGKKKLPKPKMRKSPADIPEFGMVRKYLRRRIYSAIDPSEIVEVYGYQTKIRREKFKLPYSKLNNAFAIAASTESQSSSDKVYCYKILRRHNRMLHNATVLKGGTRKLHQAPYIVKGFRLWDKVLFENQECFVAGRRKTGYFLLKDIKGNIVHTAASYKRIRLLEMSKGYIVAEYSRKESMFGAE